VEIQLKRLENRLAERKLSLKVTDKAKEFLAREGYDPIFGARPLKRAIQRALQDPLARRLLEREFAEGDTITVDAARGELILSKE
jgi:ATP-dependent Clp protease ATP-binding subunit ClpB